MKFFKNINSLAFKSRISFENADDSGCYSLCSFTQPYDFFKNSLLDTLAESKFSKNIAK